MIRALKEQVKTALSRQPQPARTPPPPSGLTAELLNAGTPVYKTKSEEAYDRLCEIIFHATKQLSQAQLEAIDDDQFLRKLHDESFRREFSEDSETERRRTALAELLIETVGSEENII